MSSIRPYVLSPGIVSRSLADDVFYDRLPEFRQLRPKLEAMRVDTKRAGGCSGCRSRRVARNLHGDFSRIVQTLNEDGVRRLKAYLQVEKIMLNTVDTNTGAVRVKVI